ncbi:MAG TPA: hypothetical protein DCF68_00455 [Cyanothece sp. UBA12306]|nr:hypothetical protein [Cyanothece sp. UBA12306]
MNKYEQIEETIKKNKNLKDLTDLDKLEQFISWRSDYIQNVFDAQYYQSWIIFIIIILITTIGIIISFLEFRKGINATEPTKIKVSKDGVEISSSIIGILVLIISFIFLYVYLIYVYPIKTSL